VRREGKFKDTRYKNQIKTQNENAGDKELGMEDRK
jgi:hypothetical protein